MTLYYRGPTAHITDDLLEVWAPQHRVFRIDDLGPVYVLPGTGRSGGAVALLGAAAGAAAGVGFLFRATWAVGLVLAMLFAAGAFALAAIRGAAAPRPYELRGVYDGADVLLYRCPDARTFGQVRRALTRAIERHADREWRSPY